VNPNLTQLIQRLRPVVTPAPSVFAMQPLGSFNPRGVFLQIENEIIMGKSFNITCGFFSQATLKKRWKRFCVDVSGENTNRKKVVKSKRECLFSPTFATYLC